MKLEKISKKNKNAIVILSAIVLLIAIVALASLLVSIKKSADFRDSAESEIKSLIDEYAQEPSINGLAGIQMNLDELILLAKSNGYQKLELDRLRLISENISAGLKSICVDSSCRSLSSKVKNHSAFVKRYVAEKAEYDKYIDKANDNNISKVYFVCPKLEIDFSDSYVFLCMANGGTLSYLTVLKSDYRVADLGQNGLLVYNTLYAKDNGSAMTKVNGIDTLVRVYIHYNMPKKTEFLSTYNDDDYERTKLALDSQAKLLYSAKAEDFLRVYDKTKPAILQLGDNFKHQVKLSREPK